MGNKNFSSTSTSCGCLATRLANVSVFVIVMRNLQKESLGGVLRNFAKFAGKHLCQSPSNKVAGLRLLLSLKIYSNVAHSLFH